MSGGMDCCSNCGLEGTRCICRCDEKPRQTPRYTKSLCKVVDIRDYVEDHGLTVIEIEVKHEDGGSQCFQACFSTKNKGDLVLYGLYRTMTRSIAVGDVLYALINDRKLISGFQRLSLDDGRFLFSKESIDESAKGLPA